MTGDMRQAEREAWQLGLVQPFIITQALDAHGLYGPEVDEACGTFEPAVDMWEAGQLYPAWAELEALAALTGYPVGFFTTTHEPVPFEATSMRFHLKRGQKPPAAPVLCFLPEAIEAATGTSQCPYCQTLSRPGASKPRFQPWFVQDQLFSEEAIMMNPAPISLTADEHAILTYLAATADAGNTEPVSLRGMLGPEKAALPRERFDRADWERWTELYFAVRSLLAHSLVSSVAVDGDEHPNRFQITDAGRAALTGSSKIGS